MLILGSQTRELSASHLIAFFAIANFCNCIANLFFALKKSLKKYGNAFILNWQSEEIAFLKIDYFIIIK